MSKQKKPHIPSARTNRLVARLQRLRWESTIRFGQFIKRSIDLLVCVPAMLLLLPLFLTVGLIIKLQDGGPIFFWQRRVGMGGKEFPFPKFRSMRVDAEAVLKKIQAQNQHGSEGVTFKMKRDPRITPIGRFIRRFSIDELPQIWCVVKGDMTLVGPRPPLPSETIRYNMKHRYRLSVKPGLTCFWQIGGRSEIPFEQQVDMDIDYIKQQSSATDIKVIAKTVPAVVKGKGAY